MIRKYALTHAGGECWVAITKTNNYDKTKPNGVQLPQPNIIINQQQNVKKEEQDFIDLKEIPDDVQIKKEYSHDAKKTKTFSNNANNAEVLVLIFSSPSTLSLTFTDRRYYPK